MVHTIRTRNICARARCIAFANVCQKWEGKFPLKDGSSCPEWDVSTKRTSAGTMMHHILIIRHIWGPNPMKTIKDLICLSVTGPHVRFSVNWPTNKEIKIGIDEFHCGIVVARQMVAGRNHPKAEVCHALARVCLFCVRIMSFPLRHEQKPLTPSSN